MDDVIPAENAAKLYTAADPKMLLRIIDGDMGPGLVSLETLRQISAAVEAELADRVHALETGTVDGETFDVEVQARIDAMQALAQALAAEVAARGEAIATEAKGRGTAIGAVTQALAEEVKARAVAVAAEGETRAKALSDLAARVKVLEEKPKLRIERFTGTTNAAGIATIAFSPAFTVVPDVDVIETWSGEQMVSGGLTGTPTKTGCTVQAMVSRPTLLLSAGPYQKPAAGVSVTVRAFGT